MPEANDTHPPRTSESLPAGAAAGSAGFAATPWHERAFMRFGQAERLIKGTNGV